MKDRLYSFKKFDIQLLIKFLYDEGFRTTDMAKMIGVDPDTISRWRRGTHRPRHRVQADKIIDIGCRYLTHAELEQCGVYP